MRRKNKTTNGKDGEKKISGHRLNRLARREAAANEREALVAASHRTTYVHVLRRTPR